MWVAVDEPPLLLAVCSPCSLVRPQPAGAIRRQAALATAVTQGYRPGNPRLVCCSVRGGNPKGSQGGLLVGAVVNAGAAG